MKSFDKLVSIIQEATIEAGKVDSGNKSAGVRLRKLMQDAKSVIQEVREEALLK